MDTLFFKESIFYDRDIEQAKKDFMSDLTFFEFDLMLESDDSNRKLGKIKNALVKFINTLIKAVSTFIENTKKKINDFVNSVKFKFDLKRVKQSAKKGATVEFYDVWKFEKVFKKASDDLTKKCLDIQSKCNEGCTIIVAEMKLKSLKHSVEKYNVTLNNIKENKITLDAQKVLAWLQDNYTNTGKPLGMMYIYQQTLESAEKTLNDLEERTNQYYEEHGIDNAANAYTKAMGIVSVFYKENSGWIITKTCSSLSSIFSDILEKSDKEDIADDLNGTEEERKKEANIKYSDPNYKSNKKTASKILKTASDVGNQISDAIKNNKDTTGLEI